MLFTGLAVVAPACGDGTSATDNAGGTRAVSGGSGGENAAGSAAADENGGTAGTGLGVVTGGRSGGANVAGNAAQGGKASSAGMAGGAGTTSIAGAAGEVGNGGEGGAPGGVQLPDPRCAQAVVSALQGSGSNVDPYLICLPQQLQLLDTGSYTLDRAYQLGDDLDLALLTTPLATYATSLTGTFDGRARSIAHVSNVLFKFVEASGEVRDLNISGAVEGGQALVATSARGTFRRVRVSGTFKFKEHSGPLIGDNLGLVEDCSASGSVESSGPHVGGLLGTNDGGTVRRSFSTASVVGVLRVGGLVGTLWSGTIEQSYALGPVSASGSVGGLVDS